MITYTPDSEYTPRLDVNVQAGANHGDALTFSPDGAYIAVRFGWNRGSVRILDASSGEVIMEMNDPATEKTPVLFSPDGTRVAYLCEGAPGKKKGQFSNELHVWNVPKVELERYWIGMGESRFTTAFAFSPDNETITVGQGTGHHDSGMELHNSRIAMLSLRNGRVKRSLKHDSYPPVTLKYSADGQYMVLIYFYGYHITARHVRSGKILYDLFFYQPIDRVFKAIAMSPDPRIFASGSSRNSIEVWDVMTGANIADKRGHLDWVSSIAFSRDGSTFASASKDGTIMLWNTCDWSQRERFKASECSVGSIAFSPTSPILASASIDGRVKFWEVE